MAQQRYYKKKNSSKKDNAKTSNLNYKKNQATINYAGFTLNIDIPEFLGNFKERKNKNGTRRTYDV